MGWLSLSGPMVIWSIDHWLDTRATFEYWYHLMSSIPTFSLYYTHSFSLHGRYFWCNVPELSDSPKPEPYYWHFEYFHFGMHTAFFCMVGGYAGVMYQSWVTHRSLDRSYSSGGQEGSKPRLLKVAFWQSGFFQHFSGWLKPRGRCLVPGLFKFHRNSLL